MPSFNVKGKGTYTLILHVEKRSRIKIGKLGFFYIGTGTYVYVGSAFGPGGLAARVGRHLKADKRCHWHIDYLRRISRISAVWHTVHSTRREHDWTRILMETRGAQIPIFGFGASDCHCPSHLVRFERGPGISTFRQKIRLRFAADPPVGRTIIT